MPVSLRSAWLISRACRPMWLSPISPSSSARGTRAATRVDHQHVDRAGAHQRVGDLQRLLAGIGLARSAGCRYRRRASAHRSGRARARHRRRRRCRRASAPRRSRAAPAWSCPSFPARRSRRCARAAGRRCRARCRARASRTEITSIVSSICCEPSRMIEPLPNARSICRTAASSALFFSITHSLRALRKPVRPAAARSRVAGSLSCRAGPDNGCGGRVQEFVRYLFVSRDGK